MLRGGSLRAAIDQTEMGLERAFTPLSPLTAIYTEEELAEYSKVYNGRYGTVGAVP